MSSKFNHPGKPDSTARLHGQRSASARPDSTASAWPAFTRHVSSDGVSIRYRDLSGSDNPLAHSAFNPRKASVLCATISQEIIQATTTAQACEKAAYVFAGDLAKSRSSRSGVVLAPLVLIAVKHDPPAVGYACAAYIGCVVLYTRLAFLGPFPEDAHQALALQEKVDCKMRALAFGLKAKDFKLDSVTR